ncbi:lipoprotein signal peptidase [Taibaiella chishuiensis]|uniref:Lipoprotein signal peptidase n=1 Tax=Taibaiella chishuiensis TaxID=1434707 RepID=A0A2P8CZD8_9BACT|nr:lipoprotein signal peptidase [Taibaiella chishuiensis]PSK90335.1 signal peptidase II [Taibaiella chishuiensis]
MKYKHLLLIVFLILLADQIIKVYVKTHFYMGESVHVAGNWFQLCFIENEGMAFGMKIMDTPLGKVILTTFRLVAVAFGFYWVKNLVKKGYGNGLLICAALILAGAAGNLIDSLFYGLIFTESGLDIAHMVAPGKGYGSFLHGKVVDMFYFPLVDTTWPNWVPVWGGKPLRFFEPIFNLADAAISTGVLTLLFFQKRLLTPQTTPKNERTESAGTPTGSAMSDAAKGE